MCLHHYTHVCTGSKPPNRVLINSECMYVCMYVCTYVLQHGECKNRTSSCNQKSHIRKQCMYVCMYVHMYYSIENVKTEQVVVTRSLYICMYVHMNVHMYVHVYMKHTAHSRPLPFQIWGAVDILLTAGASTQDRCNRNMTPLQHLVESLAKRPKSAPMSPLGNISAMATTEQRVLDMDGKTLLASVQASKMYTHLKPIPKLRVDRFLQLCTLEDR